MFTGMNGINGDTLFMVQSLFLTGIPTESSPIILQVADEIIEVKLQVQDSDVSFSVEIYNKYVV